MCHCLLQSTVRFPSIHVSSKVSQDNGPPLAHLHAVTYVCVSCHIEHSWVGFFSQKFCMEILVQTCDPLKVIPRSSPQQHTPSGFVILIPAFTLLNHHRLISGCVYAQKGEFRAACRCLPQVTLSSLRPDHVPSGGCVSQCASQHTFVSWNGRKSLHSCVWIHLHAADWMKWSLAASYYAYAHRKTNRTGIGRPIRHAHMAPVLWNRSWQHTPTRLQQGSSGFTGQRWSQVSSSAMAHAPLGFPFPFQVNIFSFCHSVHIFVRCLWASHMFFVVWYVQLLILFPHFNLIF